ncbi:MAG TPA: GH25 family lysozyme [Rhizomicrobium sp.]|jgi:lysozyme|nr:GH25 family lysozyme [Rhizomicrobium sp.]
MVVSRKLLVVAGCAVAAAAVAALGVQLYLMGVFRLAYPDSHEFPVRGIDVSHHQRDIDWQKLSRQNIRFAYIKASEGGAWRDPLFAKNVAAARAAGVAVGGYHYFSMCVPGWIQAQNFIRATLPAQSLSLPPAIDLEYLGNCGARPTPQAFARELDVFVGTMRARFGVSPVLYTTQSFYDAYLHNAEFAPHPLWVRNLFGDMSWAFGRTVLFRQFANKARLDGIDGPVDLDTFQGSQAQFAALVVSVTCPAKRKHCRAITKPWSAPRAP